MIETKIQGFRLSPQQRRLWPQLQLGGSSPFCVRCTVEIEGELDRQALQAAFRQAVGRHEILRTNFRSLSAMALPLQVIREDLWPDLQLLQSEAEEGRLQSQELEFDVSESAPIRAWLATLGPGRHRLTLILSALCGDALSLANLVGEIGRCYQVESAGGSLPGPAPLQYADLAEWQNELLESEETQAGRDYWQGKDYSESLSASLPFENPHPVPPLFCIGSVAACIDPGREKIGLLCRHYSCSPEVLLLSCWHLLLWRWSAERNRVMACAFDGRKYQELAEALGLFSQYLPVECDLSAASSMEGLVEQVGEAWEQSAKWQETFAWETVVNGNSPPEEEGLFFPWSFDFAPRPEEQAFAGASFRIERLRQVSDRFKMRLSCTADGERSVTAEILFDSSLFRRADVERLAGQLQALIESLSQSPASPLGQASLLSASERNELLTLFNQARADAARQGCVHPLIEEQAAEAPHRIALVFEGQRISYGELERRSGRAARWLRRQGVGPEVPVALCMQRSHQALVAMTATLRAGGAFVPIDPSQPPQRLASMLDEAGAPLVLADSEIPFQGKARLVPAGELESAPPSGAALARPLPAPQNLAYILFTSGSSGRPKPVGVEHRQLINYLHAVRRKLDLPSQASYAGITTLAADLGHTMIFPSLCGGGCLHIVSQHRILDSDLLAQYLDLEGIDCLKIVPSHLQALLRARRSSLRPPLPRRRLVVGGEAFDASLAESLRNLSASCRIDNHYGPTEATVGVLTRRLAAHPDAWYGFSSQPLGTPIENVQVYALDRGLGPVPCWVPGELHIGGAALARGYMGQPGRTAERFIPDPFAECPGSRLYKTGDLARHWPGEGLEFLGRADAQVKLRGYRIELGEIEAALQRHPAVAEAALLARKNAQGHDRLVAYLVPSGGDSLQVDDLRTHLADWLPDYMVPASYVTLQELPLTPNGKLDRRALPDDLPEGAPRSFAAPRTPSQELLAGIWCAILGLERVGADDNFFDLGGHSLLATQMVSRIRHAFQVDLPLRAIFEAPTLSAAAGRIDEARLTQKGQSAGPVILPPARDGALPLSFGQQRLWFLDQLQPGSALYNLPVALRMEGRLDAWALQASISEIVQRHEILRSCFPAVEGRAEQLIRPAQPWALPLIDLTGLEAVRDGELARLVREEAQQPFDLADGPLLRTCLVRLAPRHHALLATMHHIVSDRWSMGVLVEEITSLYEAFKAGRPSPLADLAIQYADFACWQRNWLRGEVLESQMAYWIERLGDSPQELSLPTDRPRPRQPSHRGAVHVFLLPQRLADSLQSASRAADATSFMTLLAAFQALLGRYCGQSDVSVGTPVANRNRAEVEPLIGFFVNTLVLRTDLSGDPPFQELVGRVREVTLGAYEHQDIPFEQLVEALQPERSLSRTPLFQVMLALQNAPGRPRTLAGLETTRLAVETHTAKFDLTLTLREHAQGLLAVAEYSTDLFDASTVRRLAGHFRNLLQGVADDPLAPLSNLPLSSAGELHQMALEWNASNPKAAEESTLQERFQEQARRAPQAVALVFEEALLSYGELESRCIRLAKRMRQRGVGPESLAAICLQPSLKMATAVLAAVKAGAAYLPLDPAYPPQRLSFLLEDARPSLVLTEERFVGKLGGPASQVVCLDQADRAVGAGPSFSAPFPQSAAYLIYTSGSTGRPKGVVVSHRNAVRLFDSTRHWFGFDANDVWTLFHSYTFDFSVWELWGALLYGGRLVTVPIWQRRSPDEFCQLLRRQQVTVLNQTPSAFRQLVAADQRSSSAASSLKWVIFGGEALQIESLRPWFERYGERWPRLVNMYGITETTVHVTYRPLSRSDLGKAPGGFIGVPIPDLQIYLLDDRLRPVPMGALGEMYVGGSGPARGYQGRPAQTAQRFVPDPFSRQRGARLYRTGDLARFCQGRDLEYLGRIDHQVKIRGFRIELGEIEAALSLHPAVGEAVALAREDRPGLKRLVAYWVARSGEGKAEEAGLDLRQFLMQKLPEYIVPAAFVRMDALPLTSNGKIDRKALPAPERARPELERAYVPPRNPPEACLAKIWGEVLGLERVGVEDNFFELGGDSILSIQVIARAGQAGLRLTVKQVFQHQTVAELAAVAGTAVPVLAEQGPVAGEVPLTPVQHWFFERRLEQPHHFNQSVLLEVAPGLDPAILGRALDRLAAHHDALRLRFIPEGSGWRQFNQGMGKAASPSAPFCRLDLGGLSEAQQRRALAQAGGWLQAGLSLEEGRLMRSLFFQLGAARPGALLIVVHHLAVDGVSWRILLEDLESACRQMQRGKGPQLPAKSTSFRQWAQRLQRYAASDALDCEADRWLAASRLRSSPLPVDRSGGDNSAASARSLSLSLSEQQTRKLLREAPRAYKTRIEDLLLTALAQCLGRWTGSGSLLVNLEGHGREGLFDDIDLSRTVGWFTAIYPLALNLKGASGMAAALKSVKEQLRAVPHRGVGYGVLRYLRPGTPLARQLSQAPQAEVSFNFWGQFGTGAQGSSLFKMSPSSIGPQRSPRARRAHLLEVSGRISGGRLHMSWAYSRNLHRRPTIERLAGEFMTALRNLIDHCCSPDAGGYTPSDFPLAQIGQPLIDRLLANDREVEDLYPLSPLQHGLLFHSLYRPGRGEYVIQTTCQLDSSVDTKALREAWDEVTQRHSILRTAFVWKGLDEPLQVVRSYARPVWEEQDWRGLPPKVCARRLGEWIENDRRRGFDLSKAPLMRLALIRLTEDTSQMVWTFHHLLLDGWSKYHLLKEFFLIYQACCGGRQAGLAPSRPYRDYIEWLRGQDPSQARAFWEKSLRGFARSTPMGIDRPLSGAADQQEEHHQQTLALPTETTGLLRSQARRHRLTLNTLVQGAWALLLSRYSGRQDVAFGVTVAGRPADLEGIESMVGSFINTLPLRCRIENGQSLAHWLEDLQHQQVEMRQYEYSSLPEVKSCSALSADEELFESVLSFQNYPLDESVAELSQDLTVRGVETLEKTNYPLAVVAWAASRLAMRIVYSSQRFEAVAIRRLQGHLRSLMEGMARRLDQPLGQLSLLSQSESHQLMLEWNATRRPLGRAATILDLFPSQAKRRPDALALTFEGQALSYQELNRRSNQAANHLRQLGVGPDVVVGLCLERSLEMVLGLMAILKSGGAYLPLDPSYPVERLAFMMEDSGTPLAVTRESLLEQMPASLIWSICLERDWEAISVEESCALAGAPEQDHLAYVIYTSGSTGRPKGVAVPHRGLHNLAQAQVEEFALPCQARVAQFASLSFDASIFEIAMALRAGATLCLAASGDLLPGPPLAGTLLREQITALTLPPSALSALGPEPLPSLKNLVVAGEACPAALVADWGRRARFFNAYGPTETTVWASVARCREGTAKPPIGRPIANTRTLLLDGLGHSVPCGVAGELRIGGAGLARGYLNRPSQTAESFVPDWFSREPGERLYRTGDLARQRFDGSIEFLGRIDHQIKLRGFRIEPGEVEDALSRHPDVLEAVVVARPDPHGDPRLVAYAVQKEAGGSRQEAARGEGEETGPSSNAAEIAAHSPQPAAILFAFLRERLPAHMVPSAFVWLDALPRNPSGKVDRQALPEEQPDGQAGGKQQSPATPTEELLAGIWSDVLGVSEVGRNQAFFDLGGHSLMATQIISRIQRAFNVDLDLRSFFESPNLADLALRIDQARLSGGSGEIAPLVRRRHPEGWPLSFAQQRLWFLHQLDPGSALYNIPSAFRLKGRLDRAALEASFNQILRRHDALRTCFPASGGDPVQMILPWAPRPLPLADIAGLSKHHREAELRRLAAQQAQRPFDLEKGDLLRACLVRMGQDDHALLAAMQHIVSDGWSSGILVQELAALYAAYSSGRPSPLEELPIQYADFAAWQRQWLQGEVMERQLAYWKEHLRGAAQLELPCDRPRPARLTFQGASRSMLIEADLAPSVKALGRRHDATLFMTLLAAFQTLLCRYSGQADISVGTTIANRNRPETEGLIGFFANTIVLRSDLSARPSFSELLGRVCQTALGAYAHQDVPFEEVVEALQPRRSLNRTPLFQVALTLQNAPESALSLTGLQLEPVRSRSRLAKFDLTLFVRETRQGPMVISLEYSRDLFEASTARRMLRHLKALLRGIVADPDCSLSLLPMLSQAERWQLLGEWNATSVRPEGPGLLHHRFEEQAESCPDAAALACGPVQISYRELNRRANQAAWFLAGKGAAPDRLIGVLLERSPEMMMALLGIFKAGGAYLPLDPSYPQDRLSFMLRDCGASLALTGPEGESLLGRGVEALRLGSAAPLIDRQPDSNPSFRLAKGNLAYVIYTSGSTGQPKGVAVTHRGICNLARAQIRAFDVRPESRVLQLASLSFDASISEIAMALLRGATLCLEPPSKLLAGSGLADLIRERAFTTVTFPPSLLSVLGEGSLPPLTSLIVAGEACPSGLAAQWLSGRRFVNAYGPTEATVCATMSAPIRQAETPPIGRPIDNVQVWLLDAQGQPVPVGVPGELHVGGISLARGYLNRPGLTARKFVPHPFSLLPGRRLYRSGDLARWRGDGNIDFLGRIDRQVKVRGFRIELEEVEAALARHPLVRQAAVTLRGDSSNSQRLAAFFVAAPQHQPHEGQEAGPVELWPSVAEYFIYDDLLYFAMTNDERRNQSYQAAIGQLVEGKSVLDIGTGKDAILARFCAEAGARKVYAIEVLEDSCQKARQCIRQLGLEERITLIPGDSTRVELPEKVDVCVSELVGAIGGAEGVIPILNDARQRFLKPGGAMIPQRSLTRIAALRLPDELSRQPAFSELTGHYVEQIFQQVGHPFDLRLCIKNLPSSCLISDSDVFEDLEFSDRLESQHWHEISLTISQDSLWHGFWVWLTLQTIEGEVIDINEHPHCWLPVFFPVFYPGIEVSRGDAIRASVTRSLCENGFNLDYCVEGRLERSDGAPLPFRYVSRHNASGLGENPFYKALFRNGWAEAARSKGSLEAAAGRGQATTPSDQVRAYLREKLPDYMVPSEIVRLQALPLTPSGKIDRKALLQAKGALDAAAAPAPPATPTEEMVAAIWCGVLDAEQVGIDHNFFDLGGHSLLLAKVQARLQERLGRQIPMLDLFRWTTVRMLAERLDRQEGEQASFEEEIERGAARQASRQRRGQRRRKARQ